jgi:hypothetical protein
VTDSAGLETSGKADRSEAGDADGIWPDEAMDRPPIEILPDENLIGQAGNKQSVPNRFTHKLLSSQPYRFGVTGKRGGAILAGTPVSLLTVEGNRCWVVDGDGHHICLPVSSIEELPEADTA